MDQVNLILSLIGVLHKIQYPQEEQKKLKAGQLHTILICANPKKRKVHANNSDYNNMIRDDDGCFHPIIVISPTIQIFKP